MKTEGKAAVVRVLDRFVTKYRNCEVKFSDDLKRVEIKDQKGNLVNFPAKWVAIAWEGNL